MLVLAATALVCLLTAIGAFWSPERGQDGPFWSDEDQGF